MLAGALAYFAFFTLVPALLLFVSLLGILVEDAAPAQATSSMPWSTSSTPSATSPMAVIEGLASSARTGTDRRRARPAVGRQRLLRCAPGRDAADVPGPGGRDFFTHAAQRRHHRRARSRHAARRRRGHLRSAVPDRVAGSSLRRAARDSTSPSLDGFCSIDFGQLSGAIAVVGAMGIAFAAVMTIYLVIPTDGPTFRSGVLAGRPGGTRHRRADDAVRLDRAAAGTALAGARHRGQRLHLADLAQPGVPGADLWCGIRATST